ncbi:taste receptor type 2 member 7-like [Macrotis lagotis]|uniref:taste receptor type 2 member 7-like n=1 Tax=Macrotis lagotis TaxID=92651 RepID=UPI003D682BBF
MLSSGDKIFFTLITGEFLLGILVNGFIALVNCIDWIKNKKLSPSDLIVLSLAISRIVFSCVGLWEGYLIAVSIGVPIKDKIRITDILMVLIHNSNIWFTTLLSIFFFLKITNFSHPLFLWMKWRIDRMVFKFLVGPLIISFCISFTVMERMYYHYGNIVSREKESNVSQEIQMSKNMLLMFHILFGLVSLIPFILSAISLSLFILSLWRHNQQMQLNATGSRDPSAVAHVRAMKAVSSLLIFLLLYYIGFYFNYWSHTKPQSKLSFMLSILIMLLYPFGHSLILILWNSKLRKAALRMAWMMRYCQREIQLQVLWVPLRMVCQFLGGKMSSWSP